jgi:hypothetical protein
MKARALIGPVRTNADYKEESSADYTICKSTEDGSASLHFTIEWTDMNTGMRFARTLFLSTLADDDYMKDVHFSLEDRNTNSQGRECQKNTKTLFYMYLALMRAYNELSNGLLSGKNNPDNI